jgi:hypothetical protein
VPPIITAVALEIGGDEVAGPLTLLSPADILVGSNAFLFDLTPINQPGSMPLWLYPIAGTVMSIVAIGVLVVRYRRIEP